MARSLSRSIDAEKSPGIKADWMTLTWESLEKWAGARSVKRGRTYQRNGRVMDLKISADGELLATVFGGDRYTTMVSLVPGKRGASLESTCTCPVGTSCKHAVAVVAAYLKAVGEDRPVPVADDDDPRWAWSEGGLGARPRDLNADEWAQDDREHDPEKPISKPKQAAISRSAGAWDHSVSWNKKIEEQLRAKTQVELADLTWSLAQRFPAVYQELRERIALKEGAVGPLVAETRREIRRVTSEAAWRNKWTGEGSTPDYGNVKRRLERLLEQGYADEVVALGRDLIERGLRQVSESNDEGETSIALSECLVVVFQAVARSSLSRPEQLLFAIHAELEDSHELVYGAARAVFDAPASAEDWSVVADALADRLKAAAIEKKDGTTDFYRNFHRDRISSYLTAALNDAGREAEVRAVYEAEVRITGNYERFVRFLLEEQEFDDAERWAREGIAKSAAKYPGIASALIARLGELARARKQWKIVAAHQAFEFFHQQPGTRSFHELIKAAKKAKVEAPVRAAALRFLETGKIPYQISRSAQPSAQPAVRNFPAKRHAATRKPAAPEPPVPALAADLTIDSSWPLPVPDYLLPILSRPTPYDPGPRPRLDVLIQIAIDAKRPDEVLLWYDKMRAGSPQRGRSDLDCELADRVARAVCATHPERAIEIYRSGLYSQLPRADFSAYETAADYLNLLRPLYNSLGRAGEWVELVASIRSQYRNRPRFMELLDSLDG